MITWPLTYRPQTQSFWLETRTTRFDNPFYGTTQRVEWQGTRWRAEYRFRRGGPIARTIDAFLAGLNGPAGQVLLPDFRRLSAGVDFGTPQLVSGSATSLTVDGLDADLPAGVLIQTSTGRGHMVTADVAAGAAVAVPIAPALREPVVTGPLITAEVRILMRLVDDDQLDNPTRRWLSTEWQLSFEEVLA